MDTTQVKYKRSGGGPHKVVSADAGDPPGRPNHRSGENAGCFGASVVLLIFLACVYVGVAEKVFFWRNPTANRMSLYRDFYSVVTWQKLAKYQGN